MAFCKLPPSQIAEVISPKPSRRFRGQQRDGSSKTICRTRLSWRWSRPPLDVQRAGHMPGIVRVPSREKHSKLFANTVKQTALVTIAALEDAGIITRRGRTGLEGIEAGAEIHSRRVADQSGRLRARAVTALSGQPGGGRQSAGRARGGLPYGCPDVYHRAG